MLIRLSTHAFYLNLILVMVSGEYNESKLNSTSECDIIDNEYCIHRPLKDDCTATIIYPYTCAREQNETSCDFFIDWSVINDNFVKFTLSKYNYQMNEWIALIFSSSNISNYEVNSDIIITLLPSSSNPRILNGIIKGSDVILVDDLQENDSTLFNYNEKKLMTQKISFSKNNVDIEFSFKFNSEHSINLNKCSKNDPSKGFYMFLMSGKLDSKFNILFETATIPKIFGPFCLNSCTKDIYFLKNDSLLNHSLYLKNQEKKQVNKISLDKSKASLLNNSTTNPYQVDSDDNSSLIGISKFFSLTINESTTNVPNISATTALNSNTPINIDTTIMDYTEIVETHSTENDDKITSTEFQSSTNASIILQDVSQETVITRNITSTYIPSTSLSINYCSDHAKNLSNISLKFIYDHLSNSINYTLTLNLTGYFRIGLFNLNPENNNETFLFLAEKNQTFNSIYINRNESEHISYSIEDNKVIFSIPRDLVLSNGVYMSDCQYFKFYIGNDSKISNETFILNPSESSVLISKAELVCFESCLNIDYNNIEINLKFNVNNYLYHSDLEDLTSEKAKNLSKNIIEIFKTVLNDKFENFVIISILKENNKKGTWKRQIMADTIIIESKLTVRSQNSQKFTENNILKILRESTAFSHLYQIDGFQVIENFSQKTSTSILTTTLRPIDTEYPKVLALALVFSLLVTVLVLGGALFAYHRWQKSKSSKNSSNGGYRLAMPNRRVNYEAQMVNLDSSQDNKFSNDGSVLEFTNPAYEENKKEFSDMNFTDFTGSREVGIDIGTLEENSTKQPVIMEEINEKVDDFKNLRIILNECLNSEKNNSNENYQNILLKNNLYRTNNYENLQIENDEMNLAGYLNDCKNNEFTADNTNNSTDLSKEEINKLDDEKIFDSCDEKTEDIANIFSKNIEQNLPELFGQYLEEDLANTKQKENQLDQESLESVPKDSLNISTDEPSEDEDFKPIHKNAFKNFRVDPNNKFVIDENKSSFKELFKLQNENFENDDNLSNYFDQEKFEINTQKLKSKSEKTENSNFFSGGIAEFSTPRICALKISSKNINTGIHFCDSKNNMILDIDKDSPADLAGVKPGDKILFIDNVNVENSTCEDVKAKIIQAISSSNEELTLVVMNAIEYNIFKSKGSFIRDIKQENHETNSKNGSDLNTIKCNSLSEFNPFDDIPNEMITPFLHYSSIPPPKTFQVSENNIKDFDRENMKDDSLEESTSETISSCIDMTQKKEISTNNLNDFDFGSNFTSTTNINNESNSNPSDFFQENFYFKTPWSRESSNSEINDNTIKIISTNNKKDF